MKNLIIILILTLNQSSHFVKNMEFERLLGKPFSEVEDVIEGSFRDSSYKSSKYILYFNHEYFNSDFFGMTSNFLSVFADKKNVVQSISIHFGSVIDRPFYNSFIEKYGKPDHIQIIENKQLEGESFLKDDNGKIIQTARKGTFDLREGTFEEKPLYIIWKKDGFLIKAFLRHKQKISEITFSIN